MKSFGGEPEQLARPHFSTIAFDAFLRKNGCYRAGTEVLDVGTGIGANLCYFRQKNPEITFLGLDYQEDKIAYGMQCLKEKCIEGVTLEVGDWFNLGEEYIGRFDGIISIHTLCCFKHVKPPIEASAGLQPRWIAFNSLFYEGPLDVLIHIRDHNDTVEDDNVNGDFNIFSLEQTSKAFEDRGFELAAFEPFYPPVDLPRQPGGARGTYTMRTELHERTQFSGPVHLPWYFVLGVKKEKTR